MIVCMIQVTSRPTPDYDEVAQYLRSWGHEVWVTRIDENGDFLWDNGAGRQLTQEGFLPKPEQFPDTRVANTLWTHMSHFVFVRRIREMIRMLQPDIVQINSSNLHYISQMFRVLMIEFQRIRIAYQSRSIKTGVILKIKTLSGLVYVLTIRIIERSERIFLAMLSRGFKGRFYTSGQLSWKTMDTLVITIPLLIALLLFIPGKN